jgi:hypothetical protein
MASISDFAAHFKGGVRPNLYRVDILGPEFFTNFHFFCKGASIPASTVGAIDVPYRGRQLKVPGDRTYEEWTVTVLNDVDWQHRSAFENWSHRITAHSGNVSDFDSDDIGYYGDATVLHLDRSGTVIRRYVLQDIFPTSVAAIDLTSDGNDTVEEYTVGFAVNNVIIDGQGLDGSYSSDGFDISIGGKIDIGPFSVGFQF